MNKLKTFNLANEGLNIVRVLMILNFIVGLAFVIKVFGQIEYKWYIFFMGWFLSSQILLMMIGEYFKAVSRELKEEKNK